MPVTGLGRVLLGDRTDPRGGRGMAMCREWEWPRELWRDRCGIYGARERGASVAVAATGQALLHCNEMFPTPPCGSCAIVRMGASRL